MGRLSHSNDVTGECVCSGVDLDVNVCGSAHCCRGMVNGSVGAVAF